MAELTISVTEPGADYMGAAVRIFTRKVPNEFAYPLQQGDRIQCLVNQSNEWYADICVHTVWRNADGNIHIQLSTVYQDPGEKMEPIIQRSNTYLTVWRTAIDGYLPDLLLTSGWTEWSP